jgi:hypothetical protein
MFPPAPANHATAYEGNVLGFFRRERFAIHAPVPKGFTGLDSLSIVSLRSRRAVRPSCSPDADACPSPVPVAVLRSTLAWPLSRAACRRVVTAR